jgi:hypothetical protein
LENGLAFQLVFSVLPKPNLLQIPTPISHFWTHYPLFRGIGFL